MINQSLDAHPSPFGGSRVATAGVLVAEAAIATIALGIFAAASPQLFSTKAAQSSASALVVNIQLPTYPLTATAPSR
jgi:hypothetical protein